MMSEYLAHLGSVSACIVQTCLARCGLVVFMALDMDIWLVSPSKSEAFGFLHFYHQKGQEDIQNEINDSYLVLKPEASCLCRVWMCFFLLIRSSLYGAVGCKSIEAPA